MKKLIDYVRYILVSYNLVVFLIISSNFTVDPLDLACDAVKLTLLSLNTYSCNRAHVRACLNLGTFWKYRLILL